MSERFRDVMVKRTDAELLEIAAASEDDYQIEAIEAARSALRKRNLEPKAVRVAKKEIKRKAAQARSKADEPLEGYWVFVVFLLPGLFYLLYSIVLRNDGYTRKARELGRWAMWSLAFYGGLVALGTVVSTIN